MFLEISAAGTQVMHVTALPDGNRGHGDSEKVATDGNEGGPYQV